MRVPLRRRNKESSPTAAAADAAAAAAGTEGSEMQSMLNNPGNGTAKHVGEGDEEGAESLHVTC